MGRGLDQVTITLGKWELMKDRPDQHSRNRILITFNNCLDNLEQVTCFSSLSFPSGYFPALQFHEVSNLRHTVGHNRPQASLLMPDANPMCLQNTLLLLLILLLPLEY